MKMSLCYIHSEVLLFYYIKFRKRMREKKEAGKEKTQYLEN